MRSWILVALALIGCEKAGGDAKTIELPVPQVTVRLVDPGVEPRAPLRNVASAGNRSTYRATVTTELVAPRHRSAPTLTFTYEAELVDVAADGARHYRQRILTASDPKLVGRSTDRWIDARGAHLRPTLLTFPPGAEPRGELGRPEQMTISPDEAIGVGARWHEDVTVGARHASVDAELLARDGDRVRVRSHYHVETTVSGHPATRDGTTTTEWDQRTDDGSVHEVEKLVVDHPPDRDESDVTVDIAQER